MTKTKAALYARVSTEAQKQEGTIDSQVAELKQQIAAAGHELVKEYTDDGYSGTLLDRPALNQLRKDVKTDHFDAIYFHCADRIARETAYQTIIVGELLKHGKQIIISGKDYVHNPENKLTLTMLGAFAEFERAKIQERTTRGRLYRLRTGEMSSNGSRIYGYNYVKKTSDAPATLAINEEQAAVVRSVFEMFASGDYGLITISRTLEQRHVPTRTGKTRWDNDQSALKQFTGRLISGIGFLSKVHRDNRNAPIIRCSRTFFHFAGYQPNPSGRHPASFGEAQGPRLRNLH